MRVRVLFFGQLKEITGVAQEDAELSDGARVEDLFERYGRRFPKLAEFRASVAASVNQEYSGWRAPLSWASSWVRISVCCAGPQSTKLCPKMSRLRTSTSTLGAASTPSS